MAERTCIVSRQVHDSTEGLIRFVSNPEGNVVPDIRNRLPGRGVWVTAKASMVHEAQAKNLFARGLKRQVRVAPDLVQAVDDALCQAALGALGFAKKAGQCITGQDKVESAIRNGKALGVLHAIDGAEDGLRKLNQAAHAAWAEKETKRGPVQIKRVFTSMQMNLALGATHVIHAAITKGDAGNNCMKCVVKLDEYRDMEPS